MDPPSPRSHAAPPAAPSNAERTWRLVAAWAGAAVLLVSLLAQAPLGRAWALAVGGMPVVAMAGSLSGVLVLLGAILDRLEVGWWGAGLAVVVMILAAWVAWYVVPPALALFFAVALWQSVAPRRPRLGPSWQPPPGWWPQ